MEQQQQQQQQQHTAAGGSGLSVREDLHRKLFIGGLSWSIGAPEVREHFEKFGEIVDCNVPRCPKTGRSRGFAFLTFKEREQVDNAQFNRPHVLDGREVETRRAMPKEETGSPESSIATKKLFVGGLRREVGDKDLREYFAPYGKVNDAYIVRDPKGESRGFGFVMFDDTDPVDKVMLYRPHRILDSQAEVRRGLNKEAAAAASMRYQGLGPNWGQQGGQGMPMMQQQGMMMMNGPNQHPMANHHGAAPFGSYPNQWGPPGPTPRGRGSGGIGGGGVVGAGVGGGGGAGGGALAATGAAGVRRHTPYHQQQSQQQMLLQQQQMQQQIQQLQQQLKQLQQQQS